MGIHQRGKSNSIKELLVKIARREYLEIFEADATPFSTYASAWLEKKKATLARSTYGDYRSIWKKYVLPHFGDTPLCRVTRRDVEVFLDNLSDISAKRKNNIVVPLKCLFNDAARRGEIEEAPIEHLRRFKEIKPFTDPFSFAEMNRFLEHVDSHYVAYFTTAFLTGMRPNEMIALKWQWVARMLGHNSLDMIFKHYGKFIRHRSRKDGGRFLEGLKEAETRPPGSARGI